jgi:2-dehydro-3-deoxyglucarate aldolase/4-hydroxy-2-oxoheptanedioate aldolase
LKKNFVKEALASGEMVVGSEVSRIRSLEIARIYAAAGFDFLFIDTEHTCFGMETVADMVMVARLSGIVPIVRVPDAEYHLVSRALDAGAMGIIVPRVSTAEQVERIVGWVRYPPEGVRGVAVSPSHTDYAEIAPRDFIDHMNRETLLVVQIERRAALDDLDGMLSVDGLDVAAIGWMDLSTDLGIPGEIQNPLLVGSIERVFDSCRDHGVAPGMICGDLDVLSHWAGRGARFLSYSSDGMMLLEACSSALSGLRRIEGEK